MWIERLIFLSLLLAPELTLLTLPFDATRNLSAGSIWFGLCAATTISAGALTHDFCYSEQRGCLT